MSLQPPPAQDILIIGATGDLAERKLLPALWNLHLDGLLPPEGAIVGFARRESDDTAFRAFAEAAIATHSRRPIDAAAWEAFAPRLRYVSGRRDGYGALSQACQLPRRLAYLSVPASAFIETIHGLGAAGLVEGTRIVVEKPFGRDLATSQTLGITIHELFGEEQVFRIDHYLGKETVQNILVFRFGNSVFERVWNRDAIDHVQFTVAESDGIEGRGGFYEETGALRDILQNHVFQVLSLLTMEAPSSFDPEHVRDEKAKLFRAMRPLAPGDIVRGQYVRNIVDGEEVRGYREEEGVPADSNTETFAAMRMNIDNWRWAGVPFYLRTGKRLPARYTEVVIQFKEVPVPFFRSAGVDELQPNRLVVSIQPDAGIKFTFLAKEPGTEFQVQPVSMNFSYGDAFRVQPAEAYERLLHDAMDGDHTLFTRTDMVERSWELVDPVISCELPPVEFYPAGSWGPGSANALIAPDRWRGDSPSR